MTIDKGIYIRNIYYMLTYAFQVLKESNYEDINKEAFEHIDDMLTEILCRAVAQQLKQGLYREYITHTEELSTLRGKLNLPDTIRCKVQQRQVLACDVDELSADNLYNQVLKTTMSALLRSQDVAIERKQALKKLLLFFADIKAVDTKQIRWDALRITRCNQTYQMLSHICYFVLNRQLLTTEAGDYRMRTFTDDLMHRLFEKFVLEYYRKHHPELRAASEFIAWDLGADSDATFLPALHSDIMLHKDNRILIIDTKYYGQILQQQYSKQTYHSNNIFQIYAYVGNKSSTSKQEVSGMLLYAQTNAEIVPDKTWYATGHRFSVKTLDLNTDFSTIQTRLESIAEEI